MADIYEITDFHAPELDIYARLTEAQLYNHACPKDGLFIAESPNVILRALDAGFEPVSLLLEHKHIQGQAAPVIARCGKIPVYTSDLEVLTQLTGFPLTRGVLCAMRRKPLLTAEEVCAGASLIAVLEDIMNPTNLGAIFRSAAALGIDAVLLTPGCSDPYYRRSARVSMGTVFQVPWASLGEDSSTWPHPGLERIKRLGFTTVAMALRADSVSIEDPALAAQEKLALILGTEGEGLCAETISRSDYTVRIPMQHGVDSLNVAAASAVAFWQLRRK